MGNGGSTAPLDLALARDVERVLNTSMFEIYGCSEAGAMAYRRPAEDQHWEFFDEYEVDICITGVCLTAAHLSERVELADSLKFRAGE